MKYKLVALFLLCSLSPLFSQVLKFEGGTTMSYMRGKADLLADPKFSYVGGVGIDYMDKKYFYLSSSLYFQRKGAKDNNYVTIASGKEPVFNKLSVAKSFLHFNTTFRGRLPLKNGHFYLGAGPKLDLLLGHKTYKSMKDGKDDNIISSLGYRSSRWNIGAIFELGYNHNFGEKFVVGLKTDYMLDFRSVRKKYPQYTTLYNDNFRIMASFGIRLGE